MNDKLVVIHQPDFMPYIGFFDRLVQADIYVVLDNVQYARGNRDHWTNRDRIKTKKGESWITVSVQKKPRGTKINEILLSEDFDWREKCKNLLKENYGRAKYYDELMPYVEEMFDYWCGYLMDFNLNIINIINKLLDIHVETISASAIKAHGCKDELLIDIMKRLRQTRYLSGMGAKAYCNEKLYEQSGIRIIWQEFEHPVYPQLFGDFVPYLSIIDLLCNCGIDISRKIVRGEKVYGKYTNQ